MLFTFGKHVCVGFSVCLVAETSRRMDEQTRFGNIEAPNFTLNYYKFRPALSR